MKNMPMKQKQGDTVIKDYTMEGKKIIGNLGDSTGPKM